MSGFNELLMPRARRNHAAGIRPIGGSQLATLTSETNAPENIPLPVGAQAGDVLLIGGSIWTNNPPPTVTLPSGTVTVVAPVLLWTSGSTSAYGVVYLYALTASNITNGSVPIGVTGTSTIIYDLAAEALRGADTAIDGSVGQLIQATAQAMPVDMTAPGITTAANGSLPMYLATVSAGDAGATSPYAFTTPAGWTKGIDTYAQSFQPVSLSYLKQSAPGATGDITETFSRTDATAQSTSFGAWLFAVKAKSTTPPAGSVTWVNGASYGTSGVTGSMPLPSGVQAGDYLLFMTNAGSAKTFTLANSSTILAPTAYFGSTPQSQPVTAVYSYRVTATDVANGSIPVTFTQLFEVGAFRGVSTSNPIDVQSAFTIGAFTVSPTVDIPGITTDINGAMLVFLGAARTTTGGANATMTQPTGYTGQIAAQVSFNTGVFLATKAQATSGPTGDCAGATFANGNNFGNVAGLLIALKPGT